MWMPHSSFCPCHLPDRGFDGSSGNDVQGSQPTLVYPSSESGSSGISWSLAYVQTSLVDHRASGLVFRMTLRLGSVNGSTSSKFARDGDCCRRSPVNHVSYDS